MKKSALARLCSAMQGSRQAMRPFREERTRIAKLIAGPRYSENAEKKKRFVNLIGLWLSIISRNLFTKEPRVMYSTFSRSDEGAVQAMESWANDELPRMGFAEEMERIVIDALMCIGVTKITLATPAAERMSNWGLRTGDPFMKRVDLDDLVFDMNARDFDEIDFIGHRYRADLEVIESSPLYNKKARDKLAAAEFQKYNESGDERVANIGRGSYDLQDEYHEKVELWEIYCPRNRTVFTFSHDDLTGGADVVPLREAEWVGHERGPFRVLAYSRVPGNIMPKGPVLDQVELDESVNEALRKLNRQAARLKDNTFVNKKNEGDYERIRDANDGDLVPVDDPASVKPVTQAGPNQGLFLFQQAMVKLWDWSAGNVSSMGGLAAQAGTLGQEELLAQQSNGQAAGMQAATVKFVTGCLESLNWYWWHHPNKVMESKFHVEGMPDIWTTRALHPWNAPATFMPDGSQQQPLRRSGKMPDIKIDAYSMRHSTPQQKANEITQIVTQIFVPMMQLARAQGIGFDFNAFLEIISKYRDLPELRKILMTIEAPSQEPSLPDGGGKGPSETTRNYVRHDVGGDTSRAQSAELETMLEGMGNPNSQPAMNGAM